MAHVFGFGQPVIRSPRKMISSLLRTAGLLTLGLLLSRGDLLSHDDPPSEADCTLERAHRTVHFVLASSSGELDLLDLGRALEALYRELEAFFGRAPEEDLRVEVHESPDCWKSLLRPSIGLQPDLAGVFSPSRGVSYASPGPSDYDTRADVFHEVVHQFQHRLNALTSPEYHWYEEGLAYFFSMHTWDGSHLNVGVPSRIGGLQMFEFALKNLSGDVAISKAAGGAGYDPAVSAGLVHFLMTHYGPQFQSFAEEVHEGGGRRLDPSPWEAVFGPSDNSWWRARLIDHLRLWRQRWRVLGGHFEDRGKRIEASVLGERVDGVNAMAVALLKESPIGLTVRELSVGDQGRVGLVVDFLDQNHFVFAGLDSEGVLHIRRYEGEYWKSLGSYRLEKRTNSHTLHYAFFRDGGDQWAEVSWNGKRMLRTDGVGEVGIAVADGRGSFEIDEELVTSEERDESLPVEE